MYQILLQNNRWEFENLCTYELNTSLKHYFLHVIVFITRWWFNHKAELPSWAEAGFIGSAIICSSGEGFFVRNSFSHQQKCFPLKFMFLGQQLMLQYNYHKDYRKIFSSYYELNPCVSFHLQHFECSNKPNTQFLPWTAVCMIVSGQLQLFFLQSCIQNHNVWKHENILLVVF